MYAGDGACEDEVLFDENGTLRILRGIIVAENDGWVFLQRRDGDHEIAKSRIVRITRRRRA